MTVIFYDGRNALYRFAYVGRALTNGRGQATGALHGLAASMISLKRKFPDAKFVVCWDGNGDTWRSRIFPAYKQNRRLLKPSPELEELRRKISSQIGYAKQMFDILGISQIEVDEFEADDLIGILTDKAASKGYRPVVFSSDQDYLQLLAHGVTVIDSVNGPPHDGRFVQRKFHCTIDNLLKVRALIGDKSDGIPRAVPGVGPISAARYVAAGADPSQKCFNDLPRSVRLDMPRLETYWKTINLNYRLMRIVSSCADPELPNALSMKLIVESRRVLKELARDGRHSSAGYEAFIDLLAELDLHSALASRIDLWNVQMIRGGQAN